MKRFSRLEYGLKLLRRPADLNDGTPAPAAPAGTVLAEYEQFVSRKKTINITREANSLPGTLDDVTVAPFGLPFAAANRAKVPISARARPLIATFGIAGAVNHVAANDGIKRSGFIPAKAHIGDVPTGAGTLTNSKITGVPYKKKATKSYTVPYGAGAGDASTEFEARTAIITALGASRPRATISFTPEQLKYR